MKNKILTFLVIAMAFFSCGDDEQETLITNTSWSGISVTGVWNNSINVGDGNQINGITACPYYSIDSRWSGTYEPVAGTDDEFTVTISGSSEYYYTFTESTRTFKIVVDGDDLDVHTSAGISRYEKY